MENIDIWNSKHATYKGYEYIVFYLERGFMQLFDGYVKIPPTHSQYAKGMKQRWFHYGGKRHYRRDYDAVDLDVHGGLTFGNLITERNKADYLQPFTEGLWVGWDYVHCGDEMYLPKDRIVDKNEQIQEAYAGIMAIHNESPLTEKSWTWDEVEQDCIDAIEQLIKL